MSASTGLALLVIVLLVFLLIFIWVCTGYRSTTRAITNNCAEAETLLSINKKDKNEVIQEEEEKKLVDNNDDDSEMTPKCEIISDLSNKTIIITGCNKGIGRETLRVLSKTNATIIMACRDLESAKSVQKEIIKESKNDKIFLLKLDLSELSSISQFVNEFKQSYQKLDILILNAGVIPNQYDMKTMDDIELGFGVNCIGNLYLLTLLIDILSISGDKSKYSRVICVNDYVHKRDLGLFGFNDIVKLETDEINMNYSGYTSYRYSKLCLLMVMQEIMNKNPLKDKNILFINVCPGFGKTELYPIFKENTKLKGNKDRAFIYNFGCLSRGARTIFGLDKITNNIGQLAFSSVYCTLCNQDYLENGATYRGKQEINKNVDRIIYDTPKLTKFYDLCTQCIQNKVKP